MREWSREEKYRYLRDPRELSELYGRISASVWRQFYHNQPVTGLMNDPNGFVWHDNRWHLFYQWCPWGAVHGLKYWYHLFMLPDKTADRQKPQNDALPERFEAVTFISATGNCANHEKQL